MRKYGYKWAVMAAVSLSAAVIFSGCAKTESNRTESVTETQAGYRNDVSTEALRDAAAEALGENYFPNMDIDASLLESIYGISPELYEEYTAQMPMINVNVDTLIILKAKEGKLEEAENALKAYDEKMKANTMQYPMNIGKIQAAQVKTFGDYTCYLLLGGDTAAVSEQGDEAVIAYCQEENEKAASAIEEALKN